MRFRPSTKVFLALSVGLNLFLAGILGGQYLRSTRPVFELALQELTHGLSNADSALFWQVMRQEQQGYADAQIKMAEARDRLRQTISAKPFDPSISEAAFDAWRLQWENFSAIFGRTFIKALNAISPDGREAVARRIEEIQDTHPARSAASSPHQ